MRRPNPLQEQMNSRLEAQRCFVRAAALLTEQVALDGDGEALFWAALGMLRLAQSDPSERNVCRAETIIRAATRGTP